MNDGYMDASTVPVPDAGDDTLRLEIAAALILHDHPNKNSLTRPDDALAMLRNDPDFFVCADALSRADALLPLIREHIERVIRAEWEHLATGFDELQATYSDQPEVQRGLSIAAILIQKRAETDDG